jgi:hypothetical protein
MLTKLFSPVPERAARYLSAMPAAVAGQRGHDAAFAAAHAVTNGFALDETVALALLMAHYNPRCLPTWTEAELRHKVCDALAKPGAKGRGYLLNQGEALPAVAPAAPQKPKWPVSDLALIESIVREGPTAAELTLYSDAKTPWPTNDNAEYECAPIVQALFADTDNPDPLLCIGKSSREFTTRRLSYWLTSGRLSECSLIVPARMTKRTGMTTVGKPSDHTLENTGPRRFVVVEFDTGSTDEHAARLWHLDRYSPLALVVHSGGKSLHGWFPIAGCHPADVQYFMRYAASIGADAALFRNPSQFVRLPAGTREGGCRQSVLYYAPETLFQGTANTQEGSTHE